MQVDYTTTSISLASWLHANGLELLNLDVKQYPYTFCFRDGNGQLKKLIATWQKGTANGNCCAFYNSYKALIAIIKENRFR